MYVVSFYGLLWYDYVRWKGLYEPRVLITNEETKRCLGKWKGLWVSQYFF